LTCLCNQGGFETRPCENRGRPNHHTRRGGFLTHPCFVWACQSLNRKCPRKWVTRNAERMQAAMRKALPAGNARRVDGSGAGCARFSSRLPWPAFDPGWHAPPIWGNAWPMTSRWPCAACTAGSRSARIWVFCVCDASVGAIRDGQKDRERYDAGKAGWRLDILPTLCAHADALRGFMRWPYRISYITGRKCRHVSRNRRRHLPPPAA